MISLKLIDNTELTLPEDKGNAARMLADLITGSGRSAADDNKKVVWEDFANKFLVRGASLEDTVSVSHIRPLLETTIEMVLREPVEPMMQITSLFNRVEVMGLESRVIGGAIGAVYADDVPEHGQYPEVMFNVTGGLQTAYIGKSGIQASFSDEALRYTTWDIMSINLRQMRNALIRHKEQKAIAFLKTLGTELFNNLTPATSMFGVCTGRGLDMQANGSVIMDDLFKAMAHMQEEGFPPDIMLMNPQMFYQWLQDPVLRNMVLAHGGGAYFQKFQGNPGPRDPWSNGSMGLSGPSLGNRVNQVGNAAGETPTGIAGREHGMTSSPTLPPYFPWPITIMVSPFVPYDKTSGLSDVFLLSSGNIGLHLVDEDPITVEWRDEDKELVKVRIKERYGFHVANEGMGVGVLKNIPARTRNYWDGTVSAETLAVTAEVASDTDLSAVL